MDIITFIIIIIGLFILFEISKHSLFKMSSKLLILLLVIVIFLVFVVAQLDLREYTESDNAFIQTGATVLQTIKESDLGEKLKINTDKIKEKIKGDDDF